MFSLHRPFVALCLALLPFAAGAETATPLAPVSVTEWKAVYGQIDTRDRISARARIGGTLVSLTVTEGDRVEAGQVLAEIVDDKLVFQLGAIEAQIEALGAQLANAQDELTRGEALLERGVITAQSLESLRTQADVLKNQVAAARANRRIVAQQASEGKVLAPVGGRVLSVPVTRDSVLMPGEPVVMIGGGGAFLRLAVPERFAAVLTEGATIHIETPDGPATGTLAKIYPLIENGRVIADVEVAALSDSFVNTRVLVRLPVGVREALLVPPAAVTTVSGLDFVTLAQGEDRVQRAVVLGGRVAHDGAERVEVLTGLRAGDILAAPLEHANDH